MEKEKNANILANYTLIVSTLSFLGNYGVNSTTNPNVWTAVLLLSLFIAGIAIKSNNGSNRAKLYKNVKTLGIIYGLLTMLLFFLIFTIVDSISSFFFVLLGLLVFGLPLFFVYKSLKILKGNISIFK